MAIRPAVRMLGPLRCPAAAELKERNMRVLRPMLGGLLVLALTASSALAGGQPTREYFENPSQFVYAAGEACPFAVQVDTVLQAEYGITFYDAAGDPTRTLVSGRLIVKVTNLATGPASR